MKLNQNTTNEFFKILKKEAIYPVFQPIVSLANGEILGYEALSRINGDKNTLTIDKLFDAAEQLDQVWNLEKICRKKVLQSAMSIPNKKKLFLNVDPNVILDSEFVDGFTAKHLAKYGLDVNTVVFEITERTHVDDAVLLQNVVNHYKEQGFEIAIDDVGSGYSNINRICSLEPKYIKIDMQLIRNINTNKSQRSFVRIITEYCNSMNYYTIAEGIETEAELKAVVELGVNFGQGYFFQKPEKLFMELNKSTISYLTGIKRHFSYEPSLFGSIDAICQNGCVLEPDKSAVYAFSLFEQNPELMEIVIADKDNNFLGVVTRNLAYQKMGGMFGYSLYQYKEVSKIMRKDTLLVDYDFTIESVSKMSLDRIASEIYDAVIVMKEGKYFGVVTIKELLSTSIRLQVKKATESNPLTELPGNIIIEHKINSLINNENNFALMYLDIDNFKAYNDAYGFNNGDKMIKILCDAMKASRCEDDFLGHIGGDDFVIITDDSHTEEMSEKIIQYFKNSLKELYSQKDFENGFIISKNRNGLTDNFPIASISIAVVTNRNCSINDLNKMSEMIVKAKKTAKLQAGNSIAIE